MGKTSGSADVHFKEAHLKRRKCPRFAADCIVSIGAWQDVITGLFEEVPEERTTVWGGNNK